MVNRNIILFSGAMLIFGAAGTIASLFLYVSPIWLEIFHKAMCISFGISIGTGFCPFCGEWGLLPHPIMKRARKCKCCNKDVLYT